LWFLSCTKVSSNDDKQLFADNVLFTYNPSWISLIWQTRFHDNEKKMHPCELPSWKGQKATCYAGFYNSVFVIPKNAKNKEGAVKLMKFICSGDIAEKWVKYSRCPTSLKSNEVYSDLANNEINTFSQQIKTKYNDNLKEINIAKVI
jgi:hypothetical protein